MAKPIPVSDSFRNGARGDHTPWSAFASRAECGSNTLATPVSAGEDSWQDHEPLRPPSDPAMEPIAGDTEHDLQENMHLDRLRQENARLRTTLAELEQLVEEAQHQPDSAVGDRLKEYEGLLEEKSEVIRELHRRLNDQQDRPAGATPREEELLALSEELERERSQLKEDEETLMQQMRDMEVQMSRERAEIARQRNELQRLQGEIRHELEMAARDSGLRERLAPLQRRHQELMSRRGSAPAPTQAAAPQPAPELTGGGRKDSSLFRRLFGAS